MHYEGLDCVPRCGTAFNNAGAFELASRLEDVLRDVAAERNEPIASWPRRMHFASAGILQPLQHGPRQYQPLGRVSRALRVVAASSSRPRRRAPRAGPRWSVPRHQVSSHSAARSVAPALPVGIVFGVLDHDVEQLAGLAEPPRQLAHSTRSAPRAISSRRTTPSTSSSFGSCRARSNMARISGSSASRLMRATRGSLVRSGRSSTRPKVARSSAGTGTRR